MLVRGRGWVIATVAALLGGVFVLPFVAAMVLLAARIWQAAALPASHDQELAPSARSHVKAAQAWPEEILPDNSSIQPRRAT
jgi:predicted cobalt transporter CbtA